MSKENLLKDAKRYNFKPELLEKVYRLLKLLEQITQVPYLRDKLVMFRGYLLILI